MKYFILLIILATVSGCNKQVASGPDSSKNSTSTELTYKQKAYEIMDIPQVVFKENETKEYVLATYKADETVPNTKPLQYAVLKISDNSLIKKGVLPQGSVKWIDSYIIEIVSPPGMLEGNKTIADYTTQFDVKSGKPISKVKVKN